MRHTTLPTALFTSLLLGVSLSACGSSGGGETRAQAPIQPADSVEQAAWDSEESSEAPREPWAPAPWTGAFTDTAVMLANTFHIEGPVGLLEHIVASSDDAYYERAVEMTDNGLMQVIQRTSPDVPEIRVQLDAWTLAAFERVVILERIDASPIRVIASGDALWRDSDGRIASSERIECAGEVGDEAHAIPSSAVQITPSGETQESDAEEGAVDDAVEAPVEGPAEGPAEAVETEPAGAGPVEGETVDAASSSAAPVDAPAADAVEGVR